MWVLWGLASFIGVIYYLRKKRKERVAQLERKYMGPKSRRQITAHEIVARQDAVPAVIQILETTAIMASSKNIDTIEGRADFLQDRMETIEWAYLEKGYQAVLQKGLDEYKTTYYDSDVYDWQLKILVDPHSFNLTLFYAKCIYKGFLRYYEHQLQEIGNLKMDYAIKNRYKNLKKKLTEVRSILSRITGSSDAIKYFNSIKPELKKIESKIKSNI